MKRDNPKNSIIISLIEMQKRSNLMLSYKKAENKIWD
jgi:hypothetical protein